MNQISGQLVNQNCLWSSHCISSFDLPLYSSLAPDYLQTLTRPNSAKRQAIWWWVTHSKLETSFTLLLSFGNLTIIFCIHVFRLVVVRWRLPHILGTRFEFPQFLERETGVLVTLCRTQGVGYDRRVFARYSAQFASVLFAQRRNYSI